MKNKRGITLIEFIVSIALVAVVMIFLFNMLVDIQYTSKNGTFASDNQLNRASIVRAVMDDFTNLGLVGLTDSSTYGELVLTFRFQDGSSKVLTVSDKAVVYHDERWSMKSRNNRTSYQKRCVYYRFENAPCCTGENCESSVCSDYFYVHIRIPVVVSEADDNAIDDLEFFYVGKASDINASSFPSKAFLGYESNTCTA
jgi:Tfp pilus assembly protein FimT